MRRSRHLQTIILLGVISAAAGCGPDYTHVVGENGTRIPVGETKQAGTVTGPVGVNDATPVWADEVMKARECVGKSKQAFVDAFGDPSNVTGSTYSTGGTYEYFYEKGQRPLYLCAFFEDGVVRRVKVSVKDDATAGHLWSVLGGGAPEPHLEEVSLDAVAQFHGRPESFNTPGFNGEPAKIAFPVRYTHTFPDRVRIAFAARAEQPPLAGETKFSTDSDRHEFRSTGPNPLYNWRSSKIADVTMWTTDLDRDWKPW